MAQGKQTVKVVSSFVGGVPFFMHGPNFVAQRPCISSRQPGGERRKSAFPMFSAGSHHGFAGDNQLVKLPLSLRSTFLCIAVFLLWHGIIELVSGADKHPAENLNSGGLVRGGNRTCVSNTALCPRNLLYSIAITRTRAFVTTLMLAVSVAFACWRRRLLKLADSECPLFSPFLFCFSFLLSLFVTITTHLPPPCTRTLKYVYSRPDTVLPIQSD